MALTEVDRFKLAQGPVYQEFVIVDSDGTDDDPVAATIFNPTTVTVRVANVDLTNTADATSATLSGKTATLQDATNGRRYVVEFLGF